MNKRMIALILCATICIGGVSSPAQAKKTTNKISFTKSKVTLKVGKTCKLTLKKASKKKVKKIIKWKSSNKKVATVTAKGKVKAKKAGKANITLIAKLKSGKKVKAVCKVVVSKKKTNVVSKSIKEPTVTPSEGPAPTPDSPIPNLPTPPAQSSTTTAINATKMSAYTFEPQVVKADGTFKDVSYLYAYFVENQCITSYTALQEYINGLQKKADEFTLPDFDSTFKVEIPALDRYIAVLQEYDASYFEKNSLCLGCFESGRGFEYSLNHATLTTTGDASAAKFYVDRKWIVPDDSAVTCDMIGIVCIAEVPSEGLSDNTTVDIEVNVATNK